jgi:hypothetical protein
MRNSNTFNRWKRFDRFKKPIKMKTEMSIEGQKWENEGGSFLGLFLSNFLIVVGLVFVVLERLKMNSGQLDNFNSIEKVNTFDDNVSNNINVSEMNFLPSIELKMIKGNSEGRYDEDFLNHPSGEVFIFDNDKDAAAKRKPYLKLDALNKYFRF